MTRMGASLPFIPGTAERCAALGDREALQKACGGEGIGELSRNQQQNLPLTSAGLGAHHGLTAKPHGERGGGEGGKEQNLASIGTAGAGVPQQSVRAGDLPGSGTL